MTGAITGAIAAKRPVTATRLRTDIAIARLPATAVAVVVSRDTP
jgi:hypothetical protein